jgi:hypothetical protein
MPKEMFPQKQPGDGLAASHVNDLGRVVTNLSGGNQGSGLQGTSGWITGVAGGIRPPLRYAKVIHDVVEAGDTTTSGLYLIVLRFWDEANSQWTWETDEYRLDVRGFSSDPSAPQRGPVLLPEDRLIVFYDKQRGSWVPVSVEDGDKWILAPSGGIPSRRSLTEGSAVCKFMKQTLNAAGDKITWSYLLDKNGNQVTRRVFNGYRHHIPGGKYYRVSINSIGQWMVECPCEEESSSSTSTSLSSLSSASSSSISTSSTSSTSQSSQSASSASSQSTSSASSQSTSSQSASSASSQSTSSQSASSASSQSASSASSFSESSASSFSVSSESSESSSLTSSASSENPCGQCWFVFTDTGEPCTMGGGLETGEWVLVDNCEPGCTCPSGGPEECGTYYGEIRGVTNCEE